MLDDDAHLHHLWSKKWSFPALPQSTRPVTEGEEEEEEEEKADDDKKMPQVSYRTNTKIPISLKALLEL